MTVFYRYKLHHVIFWILYFACWTAFSVNYNGVNVINAFLVTCIWFIAQASVLYLCIYTLVPRLFNKKRYGVFIICTTGVVLLSALFTATCMVNMLGRMSANFTPSFKKFLLYVLMDNFFVALVAVAAKIIKDRLKNEQRNHLLEKEKTENELRFLRSQINPHFLFNAINSIYVLIKKDPDFAALTLAKFADMLRYQLYECNADKIPVEYEIAYLNNYIQMEKLRKGDTLIVNYNIDKSVKDFGIAPLLIIPFVENAFKYVSACTNKANIITLSMKFENNFFELQATNTTDESDSLKKDKAYTGIGLENVKRRLELIYDKRHSLQIDTLNNLYSVLLQIQIP